MSDSQDSEFESQIYLKMMVVKSDWEESEDEGQTTDT